jgi:aspartate/methionine/tyrosine aminotransferase
MGLRVHVPAAGCFLWVEMSHLGLDGDAVARRWARECRVLVSPGSQFGPASGG